MNNVRSIRLITIVTVAAAALAACNAGNGTTGGAYSSSDSSEGFLQSSSYSSPDMTASSEAPKAYTASGCVIGGCSSEICTDQGSGNVVSNCIYVASFACYRTARCEKQTTGACGWTKTAELSACLSSASSKATE